MILKITLAFLLMFVISQERIFAQQSFISKLYCSILGNVDAREEYKEMVYQALDRLGVKNVQDIPVKQMNKVGPLFARVKLSSFTAFGIWLDEKHLDLCTKEEQFFHIYHEAAHLASSHHQKIVAQTLGLFALVGAGALSVNKFINIENKLAKYALLSSISLSALAAIYLKMLPRLARHQEKQADLLAAATLINSGNKTIVEQYINYLKNLTSSDKETVWWHSCDEQINYLANLNQTKS